MKENLYSLTRTEILIKAAPRVTADVWKKVWIGTRDLLNNRVRNRVRRQIQNDILQRVIES